MPKLIALDDGHGMNTAGKRTPYIPEIGRSIQENEFNREVVKYLKIELERCGFQTLLVAPTNTDTPLSTRTNLANSKKADAYIAIHYNAFDGSFSGADPSGIELYVYLGHTNKEAGKLASSIAKYLRQGTPQNYRGIKEADFHVLRETNMIAVLTENGFMDNKFEALLMLDKDFQKEVAIEHAKGICDYYGVTYKAEEEMSLLKVAVVVNSFVDYPVAELLANRISAPIYTRSVASNNKVASELIVVGGKSSGLKADKFTVLSGTDRFATAAKVKKYIDSIK
ncbi:N-acetylmuramoyl-L-alanine amidase [Bacillus sp. RAR_GA_16]|uniref:N-acetylmuramoyl-L-alanine amidase family protein n=1 Tax=Bacillus sp. RAR_GA_16 TaxID=2876774 RepID=UPI001CCD610B|nr:N-acetylmuramoyl-L-alanine amidase [Bacillus sp. RAR_GA_16]MCA0173050.1 N-acetylmuramoyl-L-alanine amidase [Bacillus sp. RAR_GA_16]